MLVEVPVSSMKTSFAGSSEPCPAFQAVRARFGDIRPFLLGGVRGFFDADALGSEEPPYRPIADVDSRRGRRDRRTRGAAP